MRILSSLIVSGVLDIDTINNAAADTDKFLVADANGVVKFRTGAEVASDIGASVGYVSTVKHEVKLGEAIAKGQAVYVTSSDGTNMIVSKASNATDVTSSKTLGLLETGGAANDKVFVITEGLLAGLDTSTATAGAPVWLGTDGNLLYGLAAKPVAPAHMVFIGIVTRVNANNGEIFVKVQNGFELEELHNVLITGTPVDKAVIQYDTASGLWKNSALSGVTGSGTAGQVTYWGSASTITGSSVFTWDNTNRILQLSGTDITQIINQTNTASASSIIFRENGSTRGYMQYVGSTFATAIRQNTLEIQGNAGGIAFRNSSGEIARFAITSGNLLLNSTTDNGLRFQVTGDGFFSGAVGIGQTSLTGYNLRISSNITGIVSPIAVFVDGTIQATATGANQIFRSSPSVVASATISEIRHFSALQGTFGAGSTISTQTGFFVHSGMTGATTNYGFYGDIPSGTGRWNLYMNGTANNYMAGSLGIGTTTLGTSNLRIFKTLTGGATAFSINNDATIASDVTLNAYYNRTSATTTAATFTLTNLGHYYANQGTFGAGSIVTNQYGFFAESNLIGATNNYGFYGNIASGTGRWNLYMNGTANNYMAGSLGIGTNVPSTSLHVVGQITGNSFIPTSATIPVNGMYLPNTNTIAFSTNTQQKLILDATGNLGLGVVLKSWGVGSTAFEIGNGSIWKSGSRSVDWIVNGYNNGTNYIYNVSAAATFYRQFDGSHQFWNAPSGTAGNAITFTQAMTLFATGNLAVGTTTDAGYRLDVNGTMRVSGAAAMPLLAERTTANSNIGIQYKNATNSWFAGQADNGNFAISTLITLSLGEFQVARTGAATFSSTVTGSSFIKTGGLSTEILRADGQVYLFPLAISSPSTGQVLKYNGTNWVNDSDAGITGSGTTNYLPKFTGASTLGNSLVFDNGTQIGIRTNSPVPYDVSSQVVNIVTSVANAEIKLTNSTTGNTQTAGLLIAQYGVDTYLWNGSAGLLVFGTSNNQRARITSTGNFIINNSTTDNGLRFQVTGDGYFSGAIGIGTASLTGFSLLINQALATGTAVAAASVRSTIQSNATLEWNSYQSLVGTQAATFTLSNLRHFAAQQSSFGLNSVVTNQFGFKVDGNLIGATNNFAFHSDLNSGTGRWNLYMNGSANNYMSGSLGIGTTSLSGFNLRIAKNITGGAIQKIVNQDGTVQSDVTNLAFGFLNSARTAAASFTLPNYYHFYAEQYTLGAGSAITNQFGFVADNTLTGATNNYGFYGNIASGTGRWNLYMNGSASNYVNGELLVGSTTSTGEKLQVTGNAKFTNFILVNSAGSVTSGFSNGINLGTWDAIGYETNDLVLGGYRASQWQRIRFYTLGTERMRLDTVGNLGLGVTPSAWGDSANNTKAIQFAAGSIGGYRTINLNITQNAFFDGTNWIYNSNNLATLYQSTSGQHRWYNAPNGTAGNAITFTQAMTLDASGRLGIGTANPTSALDVIQIGGTAGISVSGGTNPQLRATDGTIAAKVQAITGLAAYIGTESNHQLRFIVNNSPIVYLFTTTNVSVGSSSDTGEKLQVNGTMRVSGASTFGGLMTISGSATTLLQITSTGSAAYIGMGDSSGSLTYIGSDDGTFLVQTPGSSYSTKFSINSAGAATFSSSVVSNSSITANNGIYASASGVGYISLLQGTAGGSGYVNFYSAGGVRQGYIGFSTTTATTDAGTLPYVAGTHAFTGAATFSSSVQAGGGTINTSAILQADSTTKGFLPPRMTAAQRTAIATPAEGLIVVQTDGVVGLYIYINSTWRSLTMV